MHSPLGILHNERATLNLAGLLKREAALHQEFARLNLAKAELLNSDGGSRVRVVLHSRCSDVHLLAHLFTQRPFLVWECAVYRPFMGLVLIEFCCWPLLTSWVRNNLVSRLSVLSPIVA